MQDKEIINQNEQLLKICLGHDNKIDIAELLKTLEKGADANYAASYPLFHIDQKNPGHYPLLHIIAGKNNSVEAAKWLLLFGADLRECDKNNSNIGNTPLLTALAKKDTELALFYINYTIENAEFSAILDQKDHHFECMNTPLILAFKTRAPENILKQLVLAGADIHISDRYNITPLHYACLFRNNDLIKLLLERGAKIHLVDNFGYTPGEYYTYQIGLLDLESPREIAAKAIANLRQLDDLKYHAADFDAEHTRTVLIDFIKNRNKISIDEDLTKVLLMPEKNRQSLNKKHYELQSTQLFFWRDLLKLLPYASSEYKNVAALLSDEEQWQKIFEVSHEFMELQKELSAAESIKEKVIASTFTIIDDVQSSIRYRDSDYAKRISAYIFKQIKNDSNVEQIAETVSAIVPNLNSLLKNSIFRCVNSIKSIRNSHKKEADQALDEQIKAGQYSAAFLTPEFENALQEEGYERYQELKNQIRLFAENISNSIFSVMQKSYQNDLKIGQGNIRETEIARFNPKLYWKITADILQMILNNNAGHIIVTLIANQYGKDDKAGSYLEFTMTESIAELKNIVKDKLGNILIKDYILTLRGETRKSTELSLSEINNSKMFHI